MSNATATQGEEVKGAGLWLIAQLVALVATVGVIIGRTNIGSRLKLKM